MIQPIVEAATRNTQPFTKQFDREGAGKRDDYFAVFLT
jgi:hypothetical protein